MKLSLGYSPCPNDTYMFASIANGMVGIKGDIIVPVIHDVETLNFMALNKILDISKISFYTYFKVKNFYQLLSSCGAMGSGCGPILISKKKISKENIKNCRIVFPGELTTAHLLFRLWEPDAHKRFFTTYDRIFDFLNTDKADCGVIIHESRFNFEKKGFKCLVDLGFWWEKKTGLPIPLGCIVLKKSIGVKKLYAVERMIRSSLNEATLNHKVSLSYAKKFSQELSNKILQRHIFTFVNDFSLDYNDIGFTAINELYLRACALKVL